MPADIIILAAIAVFILLRLRSVLGHKIGQDTPPPMRDVTPREAEGERVVQLAARQEVEPVIEMLEDVTLDDAKWPEEMRRGIESIREHDRQFTMTEFLNGAKIAFEMVHDAFNKGDKDMLKGLMNREVFTLFKTEIENRQKLDTKQETTLVSIASAEPKEIDVEKSKARVTVRFVSEQIHVSRDKDNKVVQGSTSSIHNVQDEWTFERDLRSTNPNWTLIST